MTNFKTNFLPKYDAIRNGIVNKFGLRNYDLFIRQISWTGSRPGLGDKSIVDTLIQTFNGLRPKVELLSTKEVAASGGKYSDGDYKISSLVPQYTTIDGSVGYLPSDIQLAIQKSSGTTIATEIYVNMKGPGMSSIEGDWFTIVEFDFSKNFQYSFIIRKSAKTP